MIENKHKCVFVELDNLMLDWEIRASLARYLFSDENIIISVMLHVC